MIFGEWVNVTLADGNNTSGVIINSVLDGDSYKLKIIFPGCFGCYSHDKWTRERVEEDPLSGSWKALEIDDFSTDETYFSSEEMDKFFNGIRIVNEVLDKVHGECLISSDLRDFCVFLRDNGYQDWCNGLIFFEGLIYGSSYYCVGFDENLHLKNVGGATGGYLGGTWGLHYGNLIESFEVRKNQLLR